MVNQDKICYHYGNGECKLLAYRKSPKAGLTPQKCTGWNKQMASLPRQSNNSLDDLGPFHICLQAEGLCDACKYTEAKCKLSMEV